MLLRKGQRIAAFVTVWDNDLPDKDRLLVVGRVTSCLPFGRFSMKWEWLRRDGQWEKAKQKDYIFVVDEAWLAGCRTAIPKSCPH